MFHSTAGIRNTNDSLASQKLLFDLYELRYERTKEESMHIFTECRGIIIENRKFASMFSVKALFDL